jgi:hypothetical protein
MRHGPGPPPRSDRPELLAKLNEYIDAHDIPVLQQFCYQHDILHRQLYDWPELASAVERARNKKEGNLEIKTLFGEINARVAIFSLKQLGWTDRGVQTLKGDRNAPVRLIVSEKVATQL